MASSSRCSLACSRQVSAFQWLLGCEPPALQSLAQRSLLAGLTPSRLGLDTPSPFSLIRPPPIRYRIAVNLQWLRYRDIAHSLLSPSNGLLSQMFLRLWRPCSGIRLHTENITKIQLISNIFICNIRYKLYLNQYRILAGRCWHSYKSLIFKV